MKALAVWWFDVPNFGISLELIPATKSMHDGVLLIIILNIISLVVFEFCGRVLVVGEQMLQF